MCAYVYVSMRDRACVCVCVLFLFICVDIFVRGVNRRVSRKQQTIMKADQTSDKTR